jgi:hypothetical protein
MRNGPSFLLRIVLGLAAGFRRLLRSIEGAGLFVSDDELDGFLNNLAGDLVGIDFLWLQFSETPVSLPASRQYHIACRTSQPQLAARSNSTLSILRTGKPL